jgi:hypothetical protein
MRLARKKVAVTPPAQHKSQARHKDIGRIGAGDEDGGLAGVGPGVVKPPENNPTTNPMTVAAAIASAA